MFNNFISLLSRTVSLIIFLISTEVISASTGEHVQQTSFNMQADQELIKTEMLIIDHRAVSAFDRILLIIVYLLVPSIPLPGPLPSQPRKQEVPPGSQLKCYLEIGTVLDTCPTKDLNSR